MLALEELEGFEEEKVSELANATIEDGMIRFVNTSLPITYKYKVSEDSESQSTTEVENVEEKSTETVEE